MVGGAIADPVSTPELTMTGELVPVRGNIRGDLCGGGWVTDRPTAMVPAFVLVGLVGESRIVGGYHHETHSGADSWLHRCGEL
jgi:hypothetical protein